MNETVLGVFKICLLVLLYLFFGRVLWAVWSEVRPAKVRVGDPRQMSDAPQRASVPRSSAPQPAAVHNPNAARATHSPGAHLGEATTAAGAAAAAATTAATAAAGAATAGTAAAPPGSVGAAPGMSASDATRPAMEPPLPRTRRGRRGGVGRLVVIEPRTRRGAAFSVESEITIGRGAGCSVSIGDDTFLSQLHARAFRQNGQLFIEDLGSTNGTFLNGNRLTIALQVSKGDRIQIGGTVLEAE